MITSLSSIIAPGTAAAPGSPALAGGGNAMTSAFAMLFALMPGMAEDAPPVVGDGKAKDDSAAPQDGSKAEKDGKDLPPDAILLPIAPTLPFALPPVADAPAEAATPVRASTASAAPIASLLAAMPTLSPVATGDTPTASLAGPAPATEAPTPVAAKASPVAAIRLPAGMEPVEAPDALPVSDLAAPPMDEGQVVTMRTAPVPVQPTTAQPLVEVPVQSQSEVPVRSRSEMSAQVSPDPIAPASPTTDQSRLAANVLAARHGEAPAESASDQPAPIGTTPQARAMDPSVRFASAPTIAPLTDMVEANGQPRQADLPPLPMATSLEMPARFTGTPLWRSAGNMAARPEMPARFAATTAQTATPLPVEAPALAIQPGQTAPAMQMFARVMRAVPQDEADPLRERAKPTGPAMIDPASLGATPLLTPVAATTGADQAPLDMTQHHWPQAMIDRIDRMREDAATADSRIQLSPDALGGIAVAIRREEGATHIHFTAEQAQTATLLADAQPTLVRLAEDKGMRLGQTAVDLGHSGGGERQAPQRQPEPVIPARPAFAGAVPIGDAGDSPDMATTRIA